MLTVVAIGALTYLAFYTTRPVLFAAFVPGWSSMVLGCVTVGLLRGFRHRPGDYVDPALEFRRRVIVSPVLDFALPGLLPNIHHRRRTTSSARSAPATRRQHETARPAPSRSSHFANGPKVVISYRSGLQSRRARWRCAVESNFRFDKRSD